MQQDNKKLQIWSNINKLWFDTWKLVTTPTTSIPTSSTPTSSTTSTPPSSFSSFSRYPSPPSSSSASSSIFMLFEPSSSSSSSASPQRYSDILHRAFFTPELQQSWENLSMTSDHLVEQIRNLSLHELQPHVHQRNGGKTLVALSVKPNKTDVEHCPICLDNEDDNVKEWTRYPCCKNYGHLECSKKALENDMRCPMCRRLIP